MIITAEEADSQRIQRLYDELEDCRKQLLQQCPEPIVFRLGFDDDPVLMTHLQKHSDGSYTSEDGRLRIEAGAVVLGCVLELACPITFAKGSVSIMSTIRVRYPKEHAVKITIGPGCLLLGATLCGRDLCLEQDCRVLLTELSGFALRIGAGSTLFNAAVNSYLENVTIGDNLQLIHAKLFAAYNRGWPIERTARIGRNCTVYAVPDTGRENDTGSSVYADLYVKILHMADSYKDWKNYDSLRAARRELWGPMTLQCGTFDFRIRNEDLQIGDDCHIRLSRNAGFRVTVTGLCRLDRGFRAYVTRELSLEMKSLVFGEDCTLETGSQQYSDVYRRMLGCTVKAAPGTTVMVAPESELTRMGSQVYRHTIKLKDYAVI